MTALNVTDLVMTAMNVVQSLKTLRMRFPGKMYRICRSLDIRFLRMVIQSRHCRLERAQEMNVTELIMTAMNIIQFSRTLRMKFHGKKYRI